MANERLPFTICYSIPSFTLYTLIIIMMYKKWNEYQTSFFKIFIFTYFVNLFNFILSLFLYRIPAATCKTCALSGFFLSQGIENQAYFPLEQIFAVDLSLFFTQYSIILLTAFNRATTIFMIRNNEEKWSKTLPFVLLAILFFPLLMTYQIGVGEAFYVYIPMYDCFYTLTTEDLFVVYYRLFIYMAIVTSLAAILNIISYVKLQKLTIAISKAERNLVIISIISLLIQLSTMITTAFYLFVGISYARDTNVFQISSLVNQITYDLVTMGQPWILVLFSKKTRQLLKSTYLPCVVKTSPSNTNVFQKP